MEKCDLMDSDRECLFESHILDQGGDWFASAVCAVTFPVFQVTLARAKSCPISTPSQAASGVTHSISRQCWLQAPKKFPFFLSS